MPLQGCSFHPVLLQSDNSNHISFEGLADLLGKLKQSLEVLCEKRCSLKFCKIHRKPFWHRRFPVSFAKFLKAPSLQNTYGRLLLEKNFLTFFLDYPHRGHTKCYIRNLFMKYLFNSQVVNIYQHISIARLPPKVLIKGSVYPFLRTRLHFLNNFFWFIETTCISCYTISGRLKFPVFKVDKTILNI